MIWHMPRTLSCCTALLLAALAPAVRAEAVSYGLDPEHTYVNWEVLHLGTSMQRGRFDKLTGNVSFDAKARQLEIAITVDTSSISSGSASFDRILRGGELLDVAQFPQAWFVASHARFDGETPSEIRGEITLRGKSQPLALHALRWRCGLNPVFKREVCGGDFEATLKRSDFGMTLVLPLVADEVKLLIEVEGIRGGLPQ
ncbi:MAG TPA: YceI family protein [Methylibium sp.]